jgi:cytidyltransferase-like protein
MSTSKYDVGICSGHFSILHAGHIDYLTAAKERCEKLIVVVNNDDQVKRKKGSVIINQADRVKIVAALRSVDLVVLSIDLDDSVSATLAAIGRLNDGQNICFFNSGDRKPSNANEKETAICGLYGIKTEWIDLPKVDSSSRIIDFLSHQLNNPLYNVVNNSVDNEGENDCCE